MYFLPGRVGSHHIIHQGSERVIISVIFCNDRPDDCCIIRIACEGLEILRDLGGHGFLVVWLWYAIKVNLVIIIFPVRPIEVRRIRILTGLATFINLYDLNWESIQLGPRYHIRGYSPHRHLGFIDVLEIQALCGRM